ncbi:MAG: MBL fold metallo-hydrolase [bacterium]
MYSESKISESRNNRKHPPVLKWVNHASYIISCRSIHLMTDPWLFGSAFDNGWDLLSKSEFDIKDFNSITHIWFSHEHPDHFAPQVLVKIPEEVRRKITVLFQVTKDKRVYKFLKKLNFNIVELDNRKSYKLDEGNVVTCGKMRGIDSWLLQEINGKKILNINDCVIDTTEKAKSILNTTGEIDILLTQFSYANWVGNPEDKSLREIEAKKKLECIRMQCEIFKPKKVIPFASFVYFSHKENNYHNDLINKISTVEDYLKRNCKPVPIILYPGDTWDLQSKIINDQALMRYEKDYDLTNAQFHQSDPSIEISSLISMSKKYIENIKKKNNGLFLLMLLPKKYGMKELSIYICDIDKYCIFTLKNGLKIVDKLECSDITIWSSSLAYIFKHEWGIGSVLVNGRFRASKFGRLAFDRMFMASIFNSTDIYITFGFLINRFLIKLFRVKDLTTEEEVSYHKAWKRLIKKSV